MIIRLWMVACLLVLAARVSSAVDVDYTPLLPNVKGSVFRGGVNDRLAGASVIRPQLACVPLPYLPDVVVEHQLLVCHLCAATNPCSLGTADLIAVGAGSGTSGEWDCDRRP